MLSEKFYTLKDAYRTLQEHGLPFSQEYVRKLVQKKIIYPVSRLSDRGSSPILIPESTLKRFMEKKLGG